jgi:hypothetical protein
MDQRDTKSHAQANKKDARWGVAYFFLGLAFCLSACQTLPPTSSLPSKQLVRQANTPLIVALPGFRRVIVEHSQEEYFGHLQPILESEGFPSIILVYDSQAHPLTSGSDLSSESHSIAVTRILPALVYAIRDENKIRQSQGLAPLSEIDFVGFSQGSVLAVDLLMKLRELREQLSAYFQTSEQEYQALVKDPEFRAFNNTAEDYIAIRNIQVQREKDFENDPDFKLIYEHSQGRVLADFKRFYDYLTGPKTHYPKFAEILKKEYQEKSITKVENFENWLNFAQFQALLPIRFRFFSIAGSLFGIPKASGGYTFIKNFPLLACPFIGGAAVDQIRDTRVGSEHQLQLIELLGNIKKIGMTHQAYEGMYFIVGANGEKGDGLVGQSSAHLSEHLLSVLDLEALRKGSAESLKTETLPKFPVTGIPAKHLPSQTFFVQQLGISQMELGSPVLPFLLAFLNKDTATLEKLHEKQGVPLRQFMVEIQIPPTSELKDYQFKVKGYSRDIKVSKLFNNPTTCVLIVTGVFKAKNKSESVIQFSVSRKQEKPLNFKIPVRPGKIHFVNVLDGPSDPKTKTP